MAKEWILNSAMNRFQLNYKKNVGAVANEIRKCQPKSVEEWRDYYYQHVRSREHIDQLGRRLYIKITEVISAEVEQITEQDCIEYMHQMVIERTYDGYQTEINTIYKQLQRQLNVAIEPASDEWDRRYNVDFFIRVNQKYIGLQIKPAGDISQISQIFKERSIQQKMHQLFTERFGGKVFYIFSLSDKGKKKIYNQEVIDEIRQEIERLEQQ